MSVRLVFSLRLSQTAFQLVFYFPIPILLAILVIGGMRSLQGAVLGGFVLAFAPGQARIVSLASITVLGGNANRRYRK